MRQTALRYPLISARAPGLLLASALLSACAASPPPPPPTPATQVVGVQPCSATVMVQSRYAVPEPPRTKWFGRPPPPAVAVQVDTSGGARLVLGSDTARSLEVEIPGEVRVLWDAEIHERPDGSRFTDRKDLTAYQVTITGGITGDRRKLRYDRGNDRWHQAECGEQSLWAVALPRERKVRITSDPEGASIFQSPYQWSVPEFIGTTPRDLVVLWEPDFRGIGLLFRKSGHHDVRQRLERLDEEMRVILHPLPETRR